MADTDSDMTARPRAALARVLPILGIAALLVAGSASRAHARPDEQMVAEFKAGFPELFQPRGDGRTVPAAVPDIFGPGAVLNVGHLFMKVTNFDVIGNPFTNLSTDPSGQWPGASGTEYLSFMLLGVSGVDKTATDPAAIRRMSLQPEWRPQTLAPEDRIYKSYDGKVFGLRGVDDDKDAVSHDPLDRTAWVDEDFLDGRDNDGDGLIDEDYGAIGQQMFTCVMWDDTPQALALNLNEKHVPLHLELRQEAFAFSVPGFEDFDVVNWQVFNRSSHAIDSMYISIRYDVDAGPGDLPAYFNDDLDIPFFPHGDFPVILSKDNEWGAKMDPKAYRRQEHHAVIASWPAESTLGLCPRVNLRVNGFSVVDNDGDAGRTPGISSILLLGHTTDPLGLAAPKKVGWCQFRSHVAGTPYNSGGSPVVDQQRFEMVSSGENIDRETGFITATPVDQEGDIQGWASVGPFGVTDDQGGSHAIPVGGSVELTIAFAVQESKGLATINDYPNDYAAYLNGTLSAADLFAKYPALENAFAAQVAYEGVYDDPPSILNDNEHINITYFHGRETRVRAPAGFILTESDCPDGTAPGHDDPVPRQITEFGYQWFDFDCDYCTGVWVYGNGPDFGEGPGSGKMLKRWNTAAPPPNPETNAAATYNFSDNPERKVVPARDGQIALAWDNLSEVTVDPEAGDFDTRSYRLWKVSNWRRQGGVTGPSDDDWTLLAHFRLFDFYDNSGRHIDSNRQIFSDERMQIKTKEFWPPALDSVHAGQPICPQVYIPNLSLQAVVLTKSAYTNAAAHDWVRAKGYSTSDFHEEPSTWRFNQTAGDCKYNSFHTVGLEGSGAWAEVCLNPLADKRGFIVPICLFAGDLWDQQTGEILRPTPDHCEIPGCTLDTLPCAKDESGNCLRVEAIVGLRNGNLRDVTRTKYPVGRYRYLDHEVKNGFIYFYSVTAGDSTGGGELPDSSGITVGGRELTGRRSGVEAEGIYPQASTKAPGGVWVVPNPYRGYADLTKRPSAWDLTPNATDPTGTHLDFMGMPPAPWTIQIYTVSGDLVQTLRSEDAINESVRGSATVANPAFNPNFPDDPVDNPKTITLPGFNRQADSPNDGEARWNLISRNGQDVVSGVYIFVVQTKNSTQRGRFVVIR